MKPRMLSLSERAIRALRAARAAAETPAPAPPRGSFTSPAPPLDEKTPAGPGNGGSAASASNNREDTSENLSSRLQSLFDSLDAKSGGYNQVLLYDLRREVNVSREVFDASIAALRRQGVFTLSCEEGRFGRLSADAREAGIPGPSGRLVYVARRL